MTGKTMAARGLVAALLALAAGCASPRPGAAPAPAAGAILPVRPADPLLSRAPLPVAAGPLLPLDLRERTFEAARTQVREGFYDPSFGGLNWDSVAAAYRPRALAAERSREFHEVLSRMLASLRVSHAVILSPERLAAERAREPGWTGAEVRRLPEGWVVCRVSHGSPAEKAGLRPGDVVDSIAGVSADAIAAAGDRPWLVARERLGATTAGVNGALAGNRGSVIRVVARDGTDRSRVLELHSARYPGTSVRIGNLPPARAILEIRRLDGGFGYLRLTAFVPALEPPLRSAIADMRGAPGLVIDLRGNPGGYDRLGDHLAGLLVSAPTVLTETRLRRGVRVDQATPGPIGYHGPVAVLVDGLSASASEQFTAPLQELGRVIVVGERSAGADLEAGVVDLPTGAVMMVPIGQPRTRGGRVIEGAGVQPDVEVHLTRAALLAGRDEQLEAAVRELRRRALPGRS